MAVMHFFKAGQISLGGTVHFYTVEEDVGLGKPNKRHDVMLVQFLLASIFPNVKLPGAKLTVDGVFGPTTYLWMLYCFNKMVNTSDLQFLYRAEMKPKDGTVAAPKMDQVTGFKDAGIMGYMNQILSGQGGGLWKGLVRDPTVPLELRKALIHRYTSDVQARILKGEMV